VLFCPFTAPTYAEPGIPVVSIVCDLQHKDYPQFFNNDEIYAREAFIGEVQRKADAIICISESTRQSVISHLKAEHDKTFTIHICIHSRLGGYDTSKVARHLRDLRIDGRPYMFYPANFWPHKNHHMLITAYGMYVSRYPKSQVDLVFTGALDEAQHKLRDNIRRMGLEERIHFLGYLPEDQLTAVWHGCSFLVFPSLYEGFGIPVLEAMQFGKPVLCSNVTSLPEVAGDAALYFDPRKPEEIVQCMEKIVGNRKLCADLIKRGYERLSYFQPEPMVRQYLQCIEDVMARQRQFHNEPKEVHVSS
jgi:glycosyltransferase involved in cell wall biosynthesis